MSSNPYHALMGVPAQYPRGTVGIEVEAERISTVELARITERVPPSNALLQEMTRFWTGTTDGSLRHNGVEWISAPISVKDAESALALLYNAMDETLFVPSVRTGIHIHVNAAPLSYDEFVQALRAYAVLEPLLFRFVGVEREQNIYCVPLYRAVNEQRLWQRIAKMMHGGITTRDVRARVTGALRECCKYSALNISTFTRLGTFEFRHAPTFEDREAAVNWLHLVAAVSEFRLENNATEDSLLPAKEWAMQLVPGLQWDEYVEEVRERGLIGFANSLQPFTYKVAEWGKPAGLAFDRTPMPAEQRARRERPVRTRGDTLNALIQEQMAAQIQRQPRWVIEPAQQAVFTTPEEEDEMMRDMFTPTPDDDEEFN